MIAVIFEVWPADGRKDNYMDHAARLRDELNAIDGFISVERFLNEGQAIEFELVSSRGKTSAENLRVR
jgi:cold shock CspA family protein